MTRWFVPLVLMPFALVASAQVPPELAKAVNLEKLNTADDETDPYPLGDGNTLLYASKRGGQFAVYLSKRAGAMAAFPDGKPFISPNDADIRTPFVFKDLQYFAANTVSDEKFAKLKNFDLYKRINESAHMPLLGGINQPEDEMRPWITANGAEFYFSRKLKAGWTQFVANGPVPGPIGKAKEVGFPAGYSHGTVSSTGLTMFLQGPIDKNRLGIFKSTRTNAKATWSMPEPVAKLNDPAGKRGDMAPCLSPDATKLYFASDRPGGKGGLDIWVVLVKDLK
jgi:WD40-like Beta Propeller Repeat